MTRSYTPVAAAGVQNSNEDYSPGAEAADAAGVDSLDDDLAGDALAPLAMASAAAGSVEPAPRVVAVPPELAGERLDKVLAKVFPEFSRSRLQSWIEAQRVRVDGAPAKIRQPVPLDAVIELIPDLLPEG